MIAAFIFIDELMLLLLLLIIGGNVSYSVWRSLKAMSGNTGTAPDSEEDGDRRET